MEAAEVLLQDSWLSERMQRERRRGQGVYLLHPCILLASFLAPKAVSSAAHGKSGFGAPQNGDFYSSTLQEYLPRFLPVLCKPDLLLADRNPLLLCYEDISQKACLVRQCSSSTGAFCHLLCFASWAAQTPSGNRCLLPALSAASILSLPWQDDEQRGTDLLRSLLLPSRTTSVCTPHTLQVWTTWSQPTHFSFGGPSLIFLKKYSYFQKRGDSSYGTGPIFISQKMGIFKIGI